MAAFQVKHAQHACTLAVFSPVCDPSRVADYRAHRIIRGMSIPWWLTPTSCLRVILRIEAWKNYAAATVLQSKQMPAAGTCGSRTYNKKPSYMNGRMHRKQQPQSRNDVHQMNPPHSRLRIESELHSHTTNFSFQLFLVSSPLTLYLQLCVTKGRNRKGRFIFPRTAIASQGTSCLSNAPISQSQDTKTHSWHLQPNLHFSCHISRTCNIQR